MVVLYSIDTTAALKMALLFVMPIIILFFLIYTSQILFNESFTIQFERWELCED